MAASAAEIGGGIYLSTVGDSDAGWAPAILGAAGLLAAVLYQLASATTNRLVPLAITLLQSIAAFSALYYVALHAEPGYAKLYRLDVTGLDISLISNNGIGLLLCSIGAASLFSLLLSTRANFNVAPKVHLFVPNQFYILAALGFLGLSLRLSTSRVETFSNRGEATGLGFVNLLFWAAPLAVCYGLLSNHGRSRLALLASSIITVLIVYDGNRSPLMLILVALLVRFSRANVARFSAVVFVAVPGLLIFVLQSVWRGLVRDGGSGSVQDALEIVLRNPMRAVMTSGFDTLEGTGFSRYLLEQNFRPEWWDPAVAILNFVPRAIWPDKPGLFGSTIGTELLGFTSGGVFLSGPGYLLLLTGSFITAAISYVLFVLAIGFALRKSGTNSVAAALLLTLLIRFTIAGDPFDLFLFLQSSATYFLVRNIGRIRIFSRGR